MSFWNKSQVLKLATWETISHLEQLFVEGRDSEVALKCQEAFDEVALLAGVNGWSSLTDDNLAISAVLSIIGSDPSGADSLLATSQTMEGYLKGDPRLGRWSDILITRRNWRLQAIAGDKVIPLIADMAVQQLWKGTGDVVAAGEAISKCAPGTMWDNDRYLKANYLANLFQTCAVIENWSDEQKVEAYQRTWSLFQWFIAWGSFTEFTAALQALEAEE